MSTRPRTLAVTADDPQLSAQRKAGQRLRALRLRQGMTQSALAQRMGLAHPSSISAIELGRRTLSGALIRKLAEALRCNIEGLAPEHREHDPDDPPFGRP